jgi:membrane protein implicated in regulation of membrane protease activity
MNNRITPEDADVVAQRVVARLARLIGAIVVTLLVAWVLLAGLVYAYRFTSPDGFPWSLIVFALAAVVVVVFVVRFWGRMLRGTNR